MRTAIVATAAGAAALIAASMLGVASAEAPTTTPIRTVTVEGVAIVPIAQGASAATATAAYRQGMSAAVADGQSKAEYLAGRVGGTIGAAQSVGEGGGSITCIGDGESQYVEYTGEQPDFGYSSSPVVEAGADTTAALPKPALRKPKPRHAKAVRPAPAKSAAAMSCTLSAAVSLAYLLD